MGSSMHRSRRNGRAGVRGWLVPVLCLLGAAGVVAPAPGWAQTPPEYLSVESFEVAQGECYLIDVGTPYITLDIQYSFNGGPTETVYGWPSIGPDGTATICTSSSTAPGEYAYSAARNTWGGDWVYGGDSVWVTAFEITASPGSQSVEQGGSVDYTVSVNPLYGFYSDVSLRVGSILPSGVTASFSSTSLTLPYTAASTLTLTASAGASLGTVTVYITGSGGVSRNAAVTLTVTRPVPPPPPPDFTIGATPASRTVVAGGSTIYEVSVTALHGFNGAVSLSATGWPSAETSFSSTPLTSPYTASSTLTLNVPAGTPAGTRTVTVTGTSGNLSDSDTVTLTVVPPPDFTIGATPASRTVVAGGSTIYEVSVTALHGFNGAVSLSATGWPSAETSFSSTPLTSPYTASSTLTLNVPAGTPAGTRTVTVTGTSGNLSDSDTVTLTVVPPPDFTIGATPASRTVVAGGSTTYEVSVTALHGFNGAVSLSATGWPSAETSFDSTPLTSPYTASSTLTLNVPAGTTPGTSTVTVTGTSGNLSDTDTVTLTVEDFTLEATPESQTVQPGQSATYTVSVGSLNGFNEGVTLGASGWPAGQTSFDTRSLSGPYPATATLTLNVPTGTAAGTTTVRVTGSGSGLSHYDDVTLTVVPPEPPLTITAAPASRTVVAGGSTTYTVSVNPPNGFNAAVSLSASGWPSSETSFSSTSLTSPYIASSTLTLNVPAGTAPGTSTVTVTATSGNLSGSDTVTLTVVPPDPDFTITATPTSRTVMPGERATYTVTVRALNRFNGVVALEASGWPSNATSFDTKSVSGPYPATATLTLTAGTSLGTTTVTVTGESGPLSHEDTVRLTVDRDDPMDPDFTITAAPASRTVVAGGSTTYTVLVNPLNGFNAAVSLSASGWPSSERSFNSTSLASPYTASSTLTLTVPAGTTPGTSTVTVTGTSGNLSDSDTVTLTVPPPDPDFTVTVSPVNGFVERTGSVDYAVSVDPVSGFDQDVLLRWSSVLPDDVTAAFDSTTLRSPYTTSSMLTLTTDGARVGTTTLRVTGTGGGLSRTATVLVRVLPPQPTGFSASRGAIDQGGCYTVDLGTPNITVDVDYTLDGVAQTIIERWLTVGADGTGEACSTINIGTGTYRVVRVRNTLRADWVAVDATVIVNAAPKFRVAVSPRRGYVQQTGSVTYDVSVSAENGFDQNVELAVSGLPPNVSAAAVTLSAPYPATATLTLTTNGASLGTSAVTVTGAGGGLSHADTVELTVGPRPTFTVAVNPSRGYVDPTGSVDYTVSVVPEGGFDQNVTLSVSSTLPPGVTAEFDPASLTSPYMPSSTLTLTADDAGVGTTAVRVTGEAGGTAWTQTVLLTVLPPQPARFSASLPTIHQGGCYTVDLGTPDITVDVDYTLDGVPQTIIERWLTVGADGTGEACSTRALAIGTYRVVAVRNTLRADWVAVDATVTVTPTPDFTVTVNPRAASVGATGSVTYDVSVSAENDFDQNVELSVSTALPPGVTASFNPALLTSPYPSSSILTLTAAGAVAGTYSVTMTGTGGGFSRIDTVDLTVTADPMAPDFTITAAPVSQTVTSGDGTVEVSYTVTVRALNAFNGVVALSASAPSLTGVTAGLNTMSLAGPYPSTATLTLTVPVGTAAGTTTVTVTGTSGTLSHAAPVRLTVATGPPLQREYIYLGGRVIAVESP